MLYGVHFWLLTGLGYCISKKSFLNHWNTFCVRFATFGETTKNDGKSTKCVVLVGFSNSQL